MSLTLSHDIGGDDEDTGSSTDWSYEKFKAIQDRQDELARRRKMPALTPPKGMVVEPEQLEGPWHLLAYIPCKTTYIALGLSKDTVQDATQQFKWDGSKRTLTVAHTHKPVTKDKEKKSTPVTRTLRLTCAVSEASSGTYSQDLKTTEWRATVNTKLGSVPLGLTLLVLKSTASGKEGDADVAPCMGCTGGGGEKKAVGQLLLGNSDRSVLFLLAREPNADAASEMTTLAASDEVGYWELDKRLVAVSASMESLAKK